MWHNGNWNFHYGSKKMCRVATLLYKRFIGQYFGLGWQCEYYPSLTGYEKYNPIQTRWKMYILIQNDIDKGSSLLMLRNIG